MIVPAIATALAESFQAISVVIFLSNHTVSWSETEGKCVFGDVVVKGVASPGHRVFVRPSFMSPVFVPGRQHWRLHLTLVPDALNWTGFPLELGTPLESPRHSYVPEPAVGEAARVLAHYCEFSRANHEPLVKLLESSSRRERAWLVSFLADIRVQQRAFMDDQFAWNWDAQRCRIGVDCFNFVSWITGLNLPARDIP